MYLLSCDYTHNNIKRLCAWSTVLTFDNFNKMQSEMVDFAPGAATLVNSTKQRCLTSDWYSHLANSMKHTCRL